MMNKTQIEVQGNYVYIFNYVVKFSTEEQAEEFVLKLIKEEIC